MSISIRLITQSEVLSVLSKWWITVAVMLSLLMQLLLLLTGGSRKWNRICRFVAWNAYNWSDQVATTALGGLAQLAAAGGDSDRKEVYALWAPILLLHLGAPDNISAYARADAELWKRHGLTMLLQVVLVVYVVANCARSWKFGLLSVCLTTLGSIKYAERTFALKRASQADITESALPIYKYMLAERQIRLEIKGSTTFSPQCSRSAARSATGSRYYYVISGEKQWLANFVKAGETNYIHSFEDAARATPELVTLQDILSSNELMHQTPPVVLLCVGFALFKLYKRRLCHLYMYEWREDKTRELFLGESVFSNMEKLLFVLDVELRFLFDSLYTKAADTAFSKMGVTFRILSTVLLGVSAVFILGGKLDLHNQAIKQAKGVTFCLMSAALVVEVYQLARLLLSDWCRVWLACRFILVGEKLRKESAAGLSLGCCFSTGSWRAAFLLRVLKVVTALGRHQYWISRIGQYSMIVPGRLSIWQNINAKLAGLVSHDLLQVLPQYEQSKQTVVEFKRYVLLRVVAVCKEIGIEEKVVNPDWFLPRYERRHQSILQNALGGGGYLDFEHLVVNWHVATCVCELFDLSEQWGGLNHIPNPELDITQDNIYASDSASHTTPAGNPHYSDEELASAKTGQPAEEDMRMSKLLSRYMMYLLVHKAELLPCHADIARQLTADTQRDIWRAQLTWDVQSVKTMLQQDVDAAAHQTSHLPFNLRAGMRTAAHLMQKLAPAERWKLIGSVWMDMLVCAGAACNKPNEHLEQLTMGGEFLTNLWVLLGHLGCGAQ